MYAVLPDALGAPRVDGLFRLAAVRGEVLLEWHPPAMREDGFEKGDELLAHAGPFRIQKFQTPRAQPSVNAMLATKMPALPSTDAE